MTNGFKVKYCHWHRKRPETRAWLKATLPEVSVLLDLRLTITKSTVTCPRNGDDFLVRALVADAHELAQQQATPREVAAHLLDYARSVLVEAVQDMDMEDEDIEWSKERVATLTGNEVLDCHTEHHGGGFERTVEGWHAAAFYQDLGKAMNISGIGLIGA